MSLHAILCNIRTLLILSSIFFSLLDIGKLPKTFTSAAQHSSSSPCVFSSALSAAASLCSRLLSVLVLRLDHEDRSLEGVVPAPPPEPDDACHGEEKESVRRKGNRSCGLSIFSWICVCFSFLCSLTLPCSEIVGIR